MKLARVRTNDFGSRYAISNYGDIIALHTLLVDEEDDLRPEWAIAENGITLHDNEIAFYFDNLYTITAYEIICAIEHDRVPFAMRQLKALIDKREEKA